MRLILTSVFLSITLTLALAQSYSWNDIVNTGKGKVVFYWYPNNIQVSKSKDVLDGIEHDLSRAFVSYLEEKYNVSITLERQVTNSFIEVMDIVKNGDDGVFGASSFSITRERAKHFNFTPPYMTDIAVLISNANIPVVETSKEFKEVFEGKTAVTIEQTTLSAGVENLRTQYTVNTKVKHVQNSGQIISEIISNEDTFGYIDLANFLIALEKSTQVRRQFFYPLKLEGLAFIYPSGSDWEIPVNDYFTSAAFEEDREAIIGKYLGKDVTKTIERIAKSAEIGPLEEIVLSNQEKEAQYQALLESAIRERDKILVNNVLTISTVVAVLVLLFLLVGYRIKANANRRLLLKQEEISHRNHQLQALNQEKNDLINILAHDLRSPLTHIVGIADMFKSRSDLPEDVMKLNNFLSDASGKMEGMITKILDVDAIEARQRNLEIESFCFEEIMEPIYQTYLPRAERKGIALNVSMSASVKIKGDKFYASQVVENLLSNAIKFSDANTSIEVAAKANGSRAQIFVRDEGPGFLPDEEKFIFQKYKRLNAKPTGGEHTVGLGLHIVKYFTEMMGGTITFTTAPDRGTTFFVDLPKA
ncbi:MAG: ATP-binding protein [Cyclobacteriaceae bacterium]